MQEIFHNLWAGLIGGSRLDVANLVLGIAGVWLMVRLSLWAFPVGLAAVIVQAKLFWQARLYADAAVQVFFFVALAYGWWHWVRGRGAAPELPVTRLTWGARLLVVGITVDAALLWALCLLGWTNDVMPFRDAFIAAFSVAGQVLQARKNIENWPVWIAVDLVAIASYWQADLAFTAFLYAVYLALAFGGWRSWHRAMRAQGAHVAQGA